MPIIQVRDDKNRRTFYLSNAGLTLDRKHATRFKTQQTADFMAKTLTENFCSAVFPDYAGMVARVVSESQLARPYYEMID